MGPVSRQRDKLSSGSSGSSRNDPRLQLITFSNPFLFCSNPFLGSAFLAGLDSMHSKSSSSNLSFLNVA
jgi:hypothetical protein